MEHKVETIKKNNSGAIANTVDRDGKKINFDCDVVLISVGRKPNTEGLNLEKIGVQLDQRKRIKTDKNFRTNVNNIYAIGDVIDLPMLAHKSEDEGIALAEMLAGQSGHVNYDIIPSVIYTSPEVASVGKTEEELKKENDELAAENENLWFMLDEMKESQKFSKEHADYLEDFLKKQMLQLKLMQNNKGEA